MQEDKTHNFFASKQNIAIDRYSSHYCVQTNQLLEEAKELSSLEIYCKVVTCCENIIKSNKSCPEAWWYKARALWKQFDSKKALIAIDRAISLQYNFTKALLTKSAILMDLGRYTEAITTTEDIIADYPYLEVEDIRQSLVYGAWLARK